jgi:hypothetical protein
MTAARHSNGQLELAYGQTQLCQTAPDRQMTRLPDVAHYAQRTNGSSPPPSRTIELIAAPLPNRSRTIGRVLAAVTLGAAGVGVAGVGAVATITYSLESTGMLMAGLATAADVTSLILPTSACCLWKGRRRLLAAVAWVMWAGATSITAANVAGYLASHTDVFLAGRETASTERSLVLDRVNRLRTERTSIHEQRPVAAINVLINSARVAELESLRTAAAMARRRDAIDAELNSLVPQLAGLPAVTMTDPSAALLADILRIPADEIDLRRIRLAVLLALPLTAGLLIAMAMAIGTRRSDER